MSGLAPRSRRALGRELTRLANASVAESLAHSTQRPEPSMEPVRIGFTGAPGAGKSTLISRLAKHRLSACREKGGVAILGIDPTSPLSGGSILGDRIRMDAIANEPDLYIRSLASRSSHDGLADNVLDLLEAVEGYGFREVLLETVGVGQAEHAIRHSVDTLVMVLQPNAGDAIQAMKSGVLELADIYVINKADLPGAKKSASEIRGIVQRSQAAWRPPVIETSQKHEEGLAKLDSAISEHLAWQAEHCNASETLRRRRHYHVQSLIVRRVSELLEHQPQLLDATSLAEAYDCILLALAEDTQ
ncbi:ArgK/MeaB family GTPase [Halomonas sp. DQ26W]|uniref:ArgK/MeaB family GTPase n=1 Tax=Halomonas sp. DQ26W TaxID=2282311 RepID=UPI0015F0CDEF|nr:GTP-binding protein [Halomonas sp. DQ26W]